MKEYLTPPNNTDTYHRLRNLLSNPSSDAEISTSVTQSSASSSTSTSPCAANNFTTQTSPEPELDFETIQTHDPELKKALSLAAAVGRKEEARTLESSTEIPTLLTQSSASSSTSTSPCAANNFTAQTSPEPELDFETIQGLDPGLKEALLVLKSMPHPLTPHAPPMHCKTALGIMKWRMYCHYPDEEIHPSKSLAHPHPR